MNGLFLTWREDLVDLCKYITTSSCARNWHPYYIIVYDHEQTSSPLIFWTIHSSFIQLLHWAGCERSNWSQKRHTHREDHQTPPNWNISCLAVFQQKFDRAMIKSFPSVYIPSEAKHFRIIQSQSIESTNRGKGVTKRLQNEILFDSICFKWRGIGHISSRQHSVWKSPSTSTFLVKFQFSSEETPFGTKLSLNASKLMSFGFNHCK